MFLRTDKEFYLIHELKTHCDSINLKTIKTNFR